MLDDFRPLWNSDDLASPIPPKQMQNGFSWPPVPELTHGEFLTTDDSLGSSTATSSPVDEDSDSPLSTMWDTSNTMSMSDNIKTMNPNYKSLDDNLPTNFWNLNWPIQPENNSIPQQYHSSLPQSSETSPKIDRRRKASSISSFKSYDGVERKDVYREKNRVAAAKCRAKKKQHVGGLEVDHRTQSMLNTLLKQTEQNLRDELSFWRTEALQHAYCGCKGLQDYNFKKAQAIVADDTFGLGKTFMIKSETSRNDYVVDGNKRMNEAEKMPVDDVD